MLSFLKKKPKIIVILGQTATGKSDLAVDIAKKFNGEIISADSRQVYRGMNIGSGKITKKEMCGIPHHLLDVTDPNDVFSVTDFQKLGTKAIQKILSHGKVPIICGGTGFYIDSLVHQTNMPSVPPNRKLRKLLAKKTINELNDIYKKRTSTIQFKILSFLHNRILFIKNNIDKHNPIRLIRAIEIIDALGYIPKLKKHNKYYILYIGLTLPREERNKKIYNRLISRLDSGMLDEVKQLINSGVHHERLQSFGLEYKYLSKYILGEISYEEMIKQLYRAIIQFAKRQKTWFKKNKKIHWFHPIKEKESIFNLIEDFLKQKKH